MICFENICFIIITLSLLFTDFKSLILAEFGSKHSQPKVYSVNLIEMVENNLNITMKTEDSSSLACIV